MNQLYLTEASKMLWNDGVRILQGNRLADTDEAHVNKLAEYMDLEGVQNVADMGCGFGEVSRLLFNRLPWAFFHLVNNNLYQLDRCPDDESDSHFLHYINDMCHTKLFDDQADLVMFNWSLCHVNIPSALAEAYRISNDQGRLFVYDYERVSGDNALTRALLFAHFIGDSDFRRFCEGTGWFNVETIYPGGDDTLFRKAFNNDAIWERIVKDLRPVIWTATK